MLTDAGTKPNMSESFNAVPPPSCLGHVGGIESQPNREETDLQPLEDSGEPVNRGRQEEKPANVSNDHWKVTALLVFNVCIITRV